jgi:hypothetical protein
MHVPASLGTFLDVFKIESRSGIGGGNRSPAGKGKERRPDMKAGQGNGDALTWGCTCEISKEAKILSALLPDTGRPSKMQLAHVDAMRPILRVRGLITAARETSSQASAGGNSFQSFAE